MKYTEKQKTLIKTFKINSFSMRSKGYEKISIKDGFYIIESKMNR